MKPLSRWINNANAVFWTRVVRNTALDVRSLCVFRIIMGLGLLLFYFPTFSWISETPRAFFNPPVVSMANLLRSFPPRGFFITLDLLLLLALVCVIIGFRTRFATLAYVVLSFIGLNFQYSFGKIDHYILPYVLLLCLSFSGWGSGLAVRPDKAPSKEATARSLSLAAVLICFAFFTAGFEKALNWVDFDTNTSGLAAWLYNGVYRLGRTYLLAPYFGSIPFRYLEVFDYCAVVFELSAFLFLLRSRNAWHSWLLVACLFHLLNTLLLNIPFIANVMVYLAFINYFRLYEKAKEAWQKRSYRVISFTMLTLFVVLRLRIIFNHQMAPTFFIRDYFLEPVLYISAALWVVAVVLLAISLLKSRLQKSIYKPLVN